MAGILSREEEAELACSNKKVKDISHADFEGQVREGLTSFPSNPGIARHPLSFRDKLVGEIPGAYVQAFNFTELMEANEEADEERPDLREGLIAVPFSKELKARIRSPWSKSLIVKVYGRAVGFSFLHGRLLSLWKPVGKIDCVDLGQEFFLIRFSVKEDSKANISSVAVWVRLNELPIEYYHVEALQIIGNAIGKVLRIDSHTATESRGTFAHLCIQVDVGKPLITALLIGGKEQPVSYKGVQRLCFSCGRIGHHRESCPYVVRNDAAQARETEETMEKTARQVGAVHVPANAGTTSSTSKGSGSYEGSVGEDKLVDSTKDVYGPWIMVSRKRHGSKGTKNEVPTDQSTPKMKGIGKFGPNEIAHREGKRKVTLELSPFGAQMANTVQSISNRPNPSSHNPGQAHVKNFSPKAESNLSIRGKKGIARNRASSTGTIKEVTNFVVKGADNTVRSSFLDKQSVNGDANFNFNAKSGGQSASSSLNGHQSCVCHEENQPKAQAALEV
ncbi:uncharacterized protein LOC126691511 [Quercus robur]|uniref:uncharacterized protein LOC126691511 n=1 Tax=Quercus robur TaxID=38942 RepID=UPI0021612CC6|nr:uncharacterized protein LOC126691511 [Quercus robur]